MKYSLINPIDENLSTIEQIFSNRGMSISDIKHYLNTSDEDLLENYILNMREGVLMLTEHISNHDDIFVQIDSDCDGITSAAILINYLHRRFPAYIESHLYYRLHSGKQHGIILEEIPESVKLVIAPDASSNEYEIHQKLQENDIDVLVIDHHEAEKISEYACVINNQLCDYPNKTLSGAGMTYKFCAYLDKFFKDSIVEDYLDLAALGIVADVMDLRNFETKRIVEKGLSKIKNPFFKAIIDKNQFSLKGNVTADGVAWYVAPYINAILRAGSAEEKEILFKSFLEYEAYKEVPSTKRGAKGQNEIIVEQACRTSGNVRNRQNNARDKAQEYIESLIAKNDLLKNKVLVIKCDTDVSPNLTGLIANQLLSKYQRPIVLLNKREGAWHGSARCDPRFGVDNFKDFCAESCLTLYAEGHQGAFGIAFENTEKIDTFIAYTNQEFRDKNFDKEYKVDFIFDYNNFHKNEIKDIAELKDIWGKGLEEPLVAIENVKLNRDNFKLLSPDSKPTLKIILPNSVEIMKFKSSEDEYDSLYSDQGCIIINVVGKCNLNEWNGRVTPQVFIEDYEVVGKQNFYF